MYFLGLSAVFFLKPRCFHQARLHPPSNTFIPSVIWLEVRPICCPVSPLTCHHCSRLLINLFVPWCFSTQRLSAVIISVVCDDVFWLLRLWEPDVTWFTWKPSSGNNSTIVTAVRLSGLRASMITQSSREHADQRTWEMREKMKLLLSLYPIPCKHYLIKSVNGKIVSDTNPLAYGLNQRHFKPGRFRARK